MLKFACLFACLVAAVYADAIQNEEDLSAMPVVEIEVARGDVGKPMGAPCDGNNGPDEGDCECAGKWTKCGCAGFTGPFPLGTCFCKEGYRFTCDNKYRYCKGKFHLWTKYGVSGREETELGEETERAGCGML